MQFSKKLERIIKKSGLLSENEGQLEACSGENETPVTITLEKLGQLFQTIDQSLQSQEQKVEQAERSLEISSKELADANNVLFSMNQTMNVILNNLDQGLVVFDGSGLCSKFASKAAQNHFKLDFEASDIPLTQLFNNQDSESIKDWIQILFDPTMDFNNIATLGPTALTNVDNRQLEIDYRPICDNDNKLVKVIAISKDVTDTLVAKAEAERQKNAAKTIFEIMQSPFGFKELFNSADFLINELKILSQIPKNKWKEEQDNSCRRILHSIKGAVGNYYLSETVSEIHQIEEHYLDISDYESKIKFIESCINQIDAKMVETKTKYQAVVDKLTKNIDADAQAISQSKIINFHAELNRLYPKNNPLVKKYESEFLLREFKTLFASYEQTTQSLAKSLDKEILPFDLQGDPVMVNTDSYKDLLLNFVHIFRNVCDHGIETKDIRSEKGKSAKGKITLRTQLLDKNNFKLIVEDDGNGISSERLLQKIQDTPFYEKYKGSSPQELLNVIFEPGFSTKNEVTDLSGRGVGMESVKYSIEKLGGSIKVFSQLNIGTKFEMTLPIVNEISVTNPNSTANPDAA